MSTSKSPTQETAFFSGNADYLESLYDQYHSEPEKVTQEWNETFSDFETTEHKPFLPGVGYAHEYVDHDSIRRQAAVQRLVRKYQVYGHLNANLDPLGLEDVAPSTDLSLESVGLVESDLNEIFKIDAVEDTKSMELRKILEFYDKTYCGSIGYEFMHVSEQDRLKWLLSRVENENLHPVVTDDDRKRILRALTMAECMETYLHMKYVGQKRFSLEGGESLIPMLTELVELSGKTGGKEVVIGMAHRGRLNVLVNVLGKSPAEVFGEFEGNVAVSGVWKDQGDVKYHMGFSADINTSGGIVHVALGFNPSHLAIINPVVVGSVRARQHRREDNSWKEVTPIVVHGDAAFAGQGVVMETFNMSHTRGFGVGGTIHIIINNQIGFTTSNKADARSTIHCTEVAKMVQSPIFHVNGDDPEAVLKVARLAHAYRTEFHTDVVIDMVCYRRYGHNEADEPMMTQPVMYSRIKQVVPIRRMYAQDLAQKGVISDTEAQKMVLDYRDELDRGEVVAGQIIDPAKMEKIVDWNRYLSAQWTDPVDTSVSRERIKKLQKQLTELPENFTLHNRVEKIVSDRTSMSLGEKAIDWGFAETMAYASLIDDGFQVRLTGQDVGRGTFSHRHALLHDQNSRGVYCPLKSIRTEDNYEVYNSLLSEEAVLAFEYGYSTTDPETLVIWEAQFGDFSNGAQIVIDQFISSGFVKWGRLCGLVMLLPHGYEGQGPEHSSARLERFLQLCAGDNIQVCIPTTPAQMFHLLRRQILRKYRHPLIVLSPKSLLRHKLAISEISDLSDSGFITVIDETNRSIRRDEVVRIILCTGKVYYDLYHMREHLNIRNIAIIRIEQLYPFPVNVLNFVLRNYPKAQEVVWCQEEPRNQGAWYQIWHLIRECLRKNQKFTCVSRDEAPAPAVGNYRVHLVQQQRLVTDALSVTRKVVSIPDSKRQRSNVN